MYFKQPFKSGNWEVNVKNRPGYIVSIFCYFIKIIDIVFDWWFCSFFALLVSNPIQNVTGCYSNFFIRSFNCSVSDYWIQKNVRFNRWGFNDWNWFYSNITCCSIARIPVNDEHFFMFFYNYYRLQNSKFIYWRNKFFVSLFIFYPIFLNGMYW